MDSIWHKTTEIPPAVPLPGDGQTEVAVIGGGLAGVLTAYFLQRQGIQTVVLEARRLGSGQTGGTTAKITTQHDLIYSRLLRDFGPVKALQYANANRLALAEYRRLIAAHGIDCQLENCPAYLYSTQGTQALEQEAAAAHQLGLSAELHTRLPLPFPVSGALEFPGQAQFHPLRFLAAVAQNLTVYEDTRVIAVEGNRLLTNRGTLTAGTVVFATHYPFVNHPGYYFLRMHQERGSVLALENAPLPPGMYLGVEPQGLSLRSSGPYLLLGGGLPYRTGENSSGGQYAALREAAARYWPQGREVAHWSAQDCMTLDGVPYVGMFSPAKPHWYLATGFGKWGMTGSMAAAMLLRDLIAGNENPNAPVFSPQRFTPGPSARELATGAAQAVKGLTRRLAVPPQSTLEALPLGHGGVVDYDGQKVGIYKNPQGEVFLVSVRCPHLGCQLEWNPDELSWDCPCHGSRFDYQGRLLDGPAQEDLPHG